MNQQQKFVKDWNEICKKEEGISTKKRKMKEEITTNSKQKMIDEIIKGMDEKDEKIGKLTNKNRALKMKMAKMEADLKAHNISIHRRKMPAELFNELFGSLPLVNAFGLLAKIPNGLLARNVQKMLNVIIEAMKNNKLNVEESGGPRLEISEDLLMVTKYSGPFGASCIRAIWPIPSLNLKEINKPIISFYYEIEILSPLHSCGGIRIGFCDQKFPLEDKLLGDEEHSIGIERKFIWMDDKIVFKTLNVNRCFIKGNIVGIGIIRQPNSKLKCFITLNGKLQAKVELAAKFASLEFFPALTLYSTGESVRLNFGKEEWFFKEFTNVLG